MIELQAGQARATIDPERGGRMASLWIGDRELLVGPPDGDDRSIHWGCFLMAPWAGRLAGGRLRFRARTHQLRRTHGRHAIHGLVWAAPWSVDAAGTHATLAVNLDRDGWPFGGGVRQAYGLSADRLTIEATITAGEQPMPAALGWHPWFRRDAVGGEPRLRLDARGVLARRAMLPTGAVVALDRRTDLRSGPRLGRRRLDDAFVGARSPAVLTGDELELTVAFGPASDTLVVYTPWNAVCIEPQTAQPNALALGDVAARSAGRRDLQPGESLNASIEISWRRPTGA